MQTSLPFQLLLYMQNCQTTLCGPRGGTLCSLHRLPICNSSVAGQVSEASGTGRTYEEAQL